MSDFKYEVIEEIAVLSESPRGWSKQLNIVSWNENEPKYDIREWAPDRSKMGRGVTFTKEELAMLKMALETREELE